MIQKCFVFTYHFSINFKYFHLIKKMKNYEEQTNYIRYMLNDKDLGIYSFIQNNKEIFNIKDIYIKKLRKIYIIKNKFFNLLILTIIFLNI